MKVSIIVPLYRGQAYLDQLIKQIEECAMEVPEHEVELILYNDYPGDKIFVEQNEILSEIRCINPGVNRGIHGARVEGLRNVTGEYVLFLDQDDKIQSTYISSQLKCIGDADAVVCRAVHAGKMHYNRSHVFENVVSKEFMTKKWCSIVSPGQVLIKRTSIPQIWKENILSINGADDYFLWLLMFSENKKFALNQEVLFEHVINGENTSEDVNKMMDSESQMIDILKKKSIFCENGIDILDNLKESLRRIHIKELSNCKKGYVFLRKWMEKVARGINPCSFFNEKNLKTIAIYGVGDIGRCIDVALSQTDIFVSYFIDYNAEYIKCDKKVYTLEDNPNTAEAVVLSLNDEVLRKKIEEVLKVPVYLYTDIWI